MGNTTAAGGHHGKVRKKIMIIFKIANIRHIIGLPNQK
jgi:hypothetical protein